MQERLEKIPIPFEDFEIKLSENSKILFFILLLSDSIYILINLSSSKLLIFRF